MIIAIGVMFVTSLLLVAAFTAANGDVHNSQITSNRRRPTTQRSPASRNTSTSSSSTRTTGRPARNQPATCRAKQASPTRSRRSPRRRIPKHRKNATPPTRSRRSSSPPARSPTPSGSSPWAKTVKRAGAWSPASRWPASSTTSTTRSSRTRTLKRYGSNSECDAYREERAAKGIKCNSIFFGENDDVKGPMHTNDTALACKGVEFGRAGHEPPDAVEINRKVIVEGCGSGSVTYNTATGEPSKGADFEPPPSDGSLKFTSKRRRRTTNSRAHETQARRLDQQNQSHEVERSRRNDRMAEKRPALRGRTREACGYSNLEQEGTDTNTTYASEKNVAASTSKAPTANR